MQLQLVVNIEDAAEINKAINLLAERRDALIIEAGKKQEGDGKKTKAGKPAPEVKAETAKPPEPALDWDKDVAPAITKVIEAKGREAAIALVRKFNDANGNPAAKASLIAPANWPAFVDACGKALVESEEDVL